jgi:hypothetical protein
MGKKFSVIHLNNYEVIKTPLKKWWKLNRGTTSDITHKLYFNLLSDGWKSEMCGNEVLLFSPEVENTESVEINKAYIITDSQVDETNVTIQKMNDFERIEDIFSDFIKTYNKLKENGVLRNQKDITGQLGEWVASKIYEAKISNNGINKDWDLKDADGKLYQVKSHAKSSSTSAKWSKVDYSSDAKIDYIVIVVFDQNYVLNDIYRVPFTEAVNKRTYNLILNWSQISDFKEPNLDAILEKHNISFLKCLT